MFLSDQEEFNKLIQIKEERKKERVMELEHGALVNMKNKNEEDSEVIIESGMEDVTTDETEEQIEFQLSAKLTDAEAPEIMNSAYDALSQYEVLRTRVLIRAKLRLT